MILFGIALGLIDMILMATLFIALVIGCSLDRNRNAENVKWWVMLAGGLTLMLWHWGDFTFSGLWSSILSFNFWQPVLWYFGLGLLYSVPEFYMSIRRSAKWYRESWAKFTTRVESIHPVFVNGDIAYTTGARGQVQVINKLTNGEIIQRASTSDYRIAGDHGYMKLARELLQQFVRNFSGGRNCIVNLAVNDEAFTVTPIINRGELSERIGAWTVFWPFYLVSLIIGDLLAEVWDKIANFLVSVSGRLVRLAFADVFKI